VYERGTSLHWMSGNTNMKFVVAKRKNAHNVMVVFIYILYQLVIVEDVKITRK
jgi:hypothetical protein